MTTYNKQHKDAYTKKEKNVRAISDLPSTDQSDTSSNPPERAVAQPREFKLFNSDGNELNIAFDRCLGPQAQAYVLERFKHLGTRLNLNNRLQVPHPYGAELRKFIWGKVFKGLEWNKRILDLKGNWLRNAPLGDRVVTNFPIDCAWAVNKDLLQRRQMAATDLVMQDLQICRCQTAKMGCSYCNGEFDTVVSFDQIYDPSVMDKMISMVRLGLVGYFTFHDYYKCLQEGKLQGAWFDKEATFEIKGDRVMTDVDGNDAPYDCPILMSNGRAWQFKDVQEGKTKYILFSVRDSWDQGDVKVRLVQVTASPWRFERVEEYNTYLYSEAQSNSRAKKMTHRFTATVTKKVVDSTKGIRDEMCSTGLSIVKYLRESGLPKDRVYLDGKNIVLCTKDNISGNDMVYTAPAEKVKEYIPITAGKYQPKQLESVIRSQMLAASKNNVPLDEYSMIPHAIMIAAYHSAASMSVSISGVNDGNVFGRYASAMRGEVVLAPSIMERITSFKIGKYLAIFLLLLTVSLMVATPADSVFYASGPLQGWQHLATLGVVGGMFELARQVSYTAGYVLLLLGSYVKVRKFYRARRIDIHNLFSEDKLPDGVY